MVNNNIVTFCNTLFKIVQTFPNNVQYVRNRSKHGKHSYSDNLRSIVRHASVTCNPERPDVVVRITTHEDCRLWLTQLCLRRFKPTINYSHNITCATTIPIIQEQAHAPISSWINTLATLAHVVVGLLPQLSSSAILYVCNGRGPSLIAATVAPPCGK